MSLPAYYSLTELQIVELEAKVKSMQSREQEERNERAKQRIPQSPFE